MAITRMSGFPEWSPEIVNVEKSWLNIISTHFAAYNFLPLETASVELISVLASKGEIDKEIYALERLAADTSAREFALHYDLTVPFARYVSQNYRSLAFPFKRYQIQKVWRGERPQRGRYREFYQCDLDVVANETLDPLYDLEVLLVGAGAMEKLPLPGYTIGVSNRKIIKGLLDSFSIEDPYRVIRILDKIEKIGVKRAEEELLSTGLLSISQIEKCLQLTGIRSAGVQFMDQAKAIGVHSEAFALGLSELEVLINACLGCGVKNVLADLGFVRGFDYYTGTIFEGRFDDDPQLGAICSGGRYEDLVSSFMPRKLPGVGFSIGFTRIFGKLVEESWFSAAKKSSKAVAIVSLSLEEYFGALRLAETLIARGLTVECFPPCKIGKGLAQASKKGFSWAILPAKEESGQFEIRNLELGEQYAFDPASWFP